MSREQQQPRKKFAQVLDGGGVVVTTWAKLAGRWECISLEVQKSKGGISTTVLRSIPVATILDEQREDLMARSEKERERIHRRRFDKFMERVVEQNDSGRTGRPRMYGREHFAEVAAIYSDALDYGAAPTRAVAEHFGVSQSNAAKWVYRAREMHLLPETERGKAKAGRPPPQRRKRRKS